MHRVYRGGRTACISFPLGGIGTGSVGLAGNGQLVDFEWMGRPAKGTRNGYTHLALKAERDGRLVDARVLQGDLPGPRTGELGPASVATFGHGPNRSNLAGAPHFPETVFTGEFPLATVDFLGSAFPGKVSLSAFNPFIPHNDKDSTIPAAFLEVTVQNDTADALTYTLCATGSLPKGRKTVNLAFSDEGCAGVRFASEAEDIEPMEQGEVALAIAKAPGLTLSTQCAWYRGRWFDALGVFWRDFTTRPGPLAERRYDTPSPAEADPGSVAATFTLAPGERRAVRLALAWYFPLMRNYWTDEARGRVTWRHYYATVFAGAPEAASYAIAHWDRLYSATRRFHDRLFHATLPEAVIDAVSANLSILKSPTVLRLEDGSFYGWEGLNYETGSCEGSCAHVWNYAYALPFLFPKLERSMRDLDWAYNLGPDGDMTFRLQLPLGAPRWAFRPCADGQFGGVIKAYREWKISGDTAWLAGHWQAIKANLAYAWSEKNPDGWDRDRDGVLEGRQHHTLDMELFGPNSWLTSLYLAALAAGAEMAEAMGEPDLAADYRALLASGREKTDRELFNGSYYQQNIDLTDKSILERYAGDDSSLTGDDTLSAYWNDEAGQIKYQIGAGCAIDQVLGQWHARMVGLGDILDPEHVKSALRSIYTHNFHRSFRDFFNPCRLYVMDDEAGTTICQWPRGDKPVVPVPYAEECMIGFEYQAACHMIAEGMVAEGLELVAAVRDRFDGSVRNPWNEFECGSNYARSMASYALLIALSGMTYDLTQGYLGFDPRPVPGREGDFACLFSVGEGWGQVEITPTALRLTLDGGRLSLKRVGLPRGRTALAASLDGKPLSVSWREGAACLSAAMTEGSVLEIALGEVNP